MSIQHKIGLVMFPGMTQLDVTGPYQVFSFLPNAQTLIIWKTLEPVTSNEGLQILPHTTFADCPDLDVLCVPGGGLGQSEAMIDPEILAFLKRQGEVARFVTSVCTGSLLLAAAGLLQGYRAASHWAFREELAAMGVEVEADRVVIDRNRITGGGVTAGIDFGLTIAAHLCDEKTAKFIQLLIEYNPEPPFNAGSPEQAGLELESSVRQAGKFLNQAFQAATEQVMQQQVV